MRMHQEADLDCVACGHEIQSYQSAGESSCGHGTMHYNCSYLNILCLTCDTPLTIGDNLRIPAAFSPMNHQSPVFDGANLRDNNTTSELAEIKRVVISMKNQVMNKLNDMSQDITNLNQKVLELQNEILKMKLELMQKQMKELKTSD